MRVINNYILGDLDFKSFYQLDPEVLNFVIEETKNQESQLSLIASESMMMPWIKYCLSSVLHNRTVEGNIGARYFPGTVFIDQIERICQRRFEENFRMAFANVQPHVASIANWATILSLVPKMGTIVNMSLKDGGHVSHALISSPISNQFNVVSYCVNPDDGQVNYEEIERLIIKCRPQLVISGASSYPRHINHELISHIAHRWGALHLADIAHVAGLILGNILPKDHVSADIVTLSTQKTMLGPRGGVILCNDSIINRKISKMVFPGLQGALMLNSITAKAVCIKYCSTKQFKELMKRVVFLSRTLANALREHNIPVVTEGTDTHIVLVDLSKFKFSTKEISEKLSSVGLLCNRNYIPNDKLRKIPTGIRMGTTILAQRGVEKDDMIELAAVLAKAFHSNGNDLKPIREFVLRILRERPNRIASCWLPN